MFLSGCTVYPEMGSWPISSGGIRPPWHPPQPSSEEVGQEPESNGVCPADGDVTGFWALFAQKGVRWCGMDDHFSQRGQAKTVK